MSGNEIESSRTRYISLLPFCFGRSVLDLGCGIGHGTYLLSQHTNQPVVGYDICPEAIQEATSTFKGDTLRYTTELPLYSNFQVITMIEFIEHLDKKDAMDLLATIAGADPAPVLAFTTPNGNTFPYRPASPAEYRGFHRWHYTYSDLMELKSLFKSVSVHAHVYDVQIDRFTSYMVVATNKFPGQ